MFSFDQNFKTPKPVGNVLKERNDPVYVSESYSLDSWIEKFNAESYESSAACCTVCFFQKSSVES